jgi:hypothetical protein
VAWWVRNFLQLHKDLELVRGETAGAELVWLKKFGAELIFYGVRKSPIKNS